MLLWSSVTFTGVPPRIILYTFGCNITCIKHNVDKSRKLPLTSQIYPISNYGAFCDILIQNNRYIWGMHCTWASYLLATLGTCLLNISHILLPIAPMFPQNGTKNWSFQTQWHHPKWDHKWIRCHSTTITSDLYAIKDICCCWNRSLCHGFRIASIRNPKCYIFPKEYFLQLPTSKISYVMESLTRSLISMAVYANNIWSKNMDDILYPAYKNGCNYFSMA